MTQIWKPHVTVASLLEQDGRFLMVEEQVEGRYLFNQPAGHLEEGESLLEAAIRETLEETARHFRPEAVTGVYRWQNPASGVTFLRVCFVGQFSEPEQGRSLDSGIIATHWMTRDEVAAQTERLRSPMVLQCIEDYLTGVRYPLALLRDL